jgi:hypothetical protein
MNKKNQMNLLNRSMSPVDLRLVANRECDTAAKEPHLRGALKR